MNRMDIFMLNLRRLKNIGSRDVDKVKINKVVEEAMLDRNVVLLDVRSPREYNEGHLRGAILIPEYELDARAPMTFRDKKQKIYVYCSTGSRAARAALKLRTMGYTNVHDLGAILY